MRSSERCASTSYAPTSKVGRANGAGNPPAWWIVSVVAPDPNPIVRFPLRRALHVAVVLCLGLMALAASGERVHAQDYLELTPELDARAANLYSGIMCPICNGQTISQSHAEISETMRQMVRERLAAGDTDKQIYDFMADSFGRDILASPPTSGVGLAVWLVPPVAILLGMFAVTLFIRRLRKADDLADATSASPSSGGTAAELESYLRMVDVEMPTTKERK